MNLKEKLYRRHKVFSGRAVGFYADEIILPDGKKAVREYMDHPGAVAVLPFIGDEHVVLVRQYRYPVGKITYEIPAGKLDAGEAPVSCVRRELEEETGFRAGRIKKLLSYWPTPAFANELIHIYEARGLRETARNPDDDEFIESKVVSLERALGWIKSGRIRDSKTIIALLFHIKKEIP